MKPWPIKLPARKELGPLKDMAQSIVAASAGLEGRIAPDTAQIMGDHLRLINSYYSNLIEGHKSTIRSIENAIQKKFDANEEKRYAQELCAAHVLAEKALMEQVLSSTTVNAASWPFLSDIHKVFYSHLPKEHLFTHDEHGFSDIPVMPGQMRDSLIAVGLNANSSIGPDPEKLPRSLEIFEKDYSPANYYGDEQLIAMAVSHHRLTWLHPFRDGNGRVSRLFSSLFLADSGVNRSNLWSLSRGLSKNKGKYMVNLFSVDPSPERKKTVHSPSEVLADFCEFFFEVCLDQIEFMNGLLALQNIEARIEWFVENNSTKVGGSLHPKSSRLLRSIFMEGSLKRGKAKEILNMPDSSSRRVVRTLIDEGLLTSETPKSSLKAALPTKALPYYFPDLYDPSVIGDDYIPMISK